VVRVPFLKSQIASQFTNQQRGKATLDEIEMNGGYVWDQTCFKALTYPTKPTLWRTANLLDVRSSWLPYDITVPIFQSRGVLPLMLTTCWSSLICTLTRRCATQMSWRIIEIPDLKHFILWLKIVMHFVLLLELSRFTQTHPILNILITNSRQRDTNLPRKAIWQDEIEILTYSLYRKGSSNETNEEHYRFMHSVKSLRNVILLHSMHAKYIFDNIINYKMWNVDHRRYGCMHWASKEIVRML